MLVINVVTNMVLHNGTFAARLLLSLIVVLILLVMVHASRNIAYMSRAADLGLDACTAEFALGESKPNT